MSISEEDGAIVFRELSGWAAKALFLTRSDATYGSSPASPPGTSQAGLGQIRVIHFNNAQSLPRSRRRGGVRLKAMLN
jgi:hypothetical protein